MVAHFHWCLIPLNQLIKLSVSQLSIRLRTERKIGRKIMLLYLVCEVKITSVFIISSVGTVFKRSLRGAWISLGSVRGAWISLVPTFLLAAGCLFVYIFVVNIIFLNIRGGDARFVFILSQTVVLQRVRKEEQLNLDATIISVEQLQYTTF